MAMFPSQLLLSSKHHKGQILQPIFNELKVKLIENDGFDTDRFGTFCGETPRLEGPKITVREKCLAGMTYAKKRQGLASEGSFGPHPNSPFLSINEEWLIYIDLDENLEVYGRSISMELCHEQLSYKDEQLNSFLSRIQFGAQALVLKDAHTHAVIRKGIRTEAELSSLISQHPTWLLETDLRAHLNPKRQLNILAAGKDLIQRMGSCCPQCSKPDFSVVSYSGQLPCSICQRPTHTHQFLEYNCSFCHFKLTKKRKDLRTEDPQYCHNCNP
jgi:hypothetical protein